MTLFRNRLFQATLLVILICSCCNSGSKKNENTESGIDSTLSWSQRMGETYMKQYPELIYLEGRKNPKWEYTFGLIGLSYIDLWKQTGNIKYYNYCKAYADSLVNSDGSIKTYAKTDYNIDRINPGKILFTLYKETSNNSYKYALDTLRQQLKEHPRTKAGGFWHKKRYPHQMWLDGLYMAAPFYAQYAKEFNEPEDFDDIANWLVTMEKVSRDSKTGLLYHGWDESREQKWADKKTGLSPNFWGRGMGWYGMALVDVLDYFPQNHPQRDSIISIVQRMAEAIVKVQDKQTGVWYQVLDQGGREGNYAEGSVSCMFTYFLLKAGKMGYIDSTYLETAKIAYNGILNNLIKIQDDGCVIITPVCAVAGLGGEPYRDGSFDYYINEKQRDNDPKAVGPFIMASILYENLY